MYWADPAAWTVYGLVFSQLGDHTELIRVPGQPEQPVRVFLEEYLGLQDDYFVLVTVLHIALSMLFGIVFGCHRPPQQGNGEGGDLERAPWLHSEDWTTEIEEASEAGRRRG
jgi:hypothetical protein